jgi:hypothetical protein
MALQYAPTRVQPSGVRQWIVLPMVIILGVLLLAPVGGTIIERVKMATASEDLRVLAASVTLFLTDTGEAPARLTGDSGCAYKAVDSRELACAGVLFTGLLEHDVPLLGPKLNGSGGQCGYNPSVSRLEQVTGSGAPSTCDGTRRVLGWENVADHLIRNRRGYPISRMGGWQGPYLSQNKLDPWGNSYLILVKPLWAQAQGEPLGLAISAGPNGIIETDLRVMRKPASGWPGGDDVATFVGR